MSADLLRRAAAEMRADSQAGPRGVQTFNALADWLDNEAEHLDSSVAIWKTSSQDPVNQWAERGMTVESNVAHHWYDAIKTARAYMGGTE